MGKRHIMGGVKLHNWCLNNNKILTTTILIENALDVNIVVGHDQHRTNITYSIRRSLKDGTFGYVLFVLSMT